MKKFQELKIKANLFSNFYFKFIRLASNLEYISEMFIWEFMHKLTLRLQDCLNSEVELLTLISALAKRYLFIYKQMQAIDRIRNRIKFLQSTQSSACIYLSSKTYHVLITNSRTNTSFSCLFSFITRTLMPTP